VGRGGRLQAQRQRGVLRPQLPQEVDEGPVRGAVPVPPAQHAQGQRQALQPGQHQAGLWVAEGKCKYI